MRISPPSPRHWLGCGLLLGLLGCAPDDEAQPPRTPESVQNLLLISIDSLRADHLSAYGYERPTSPNIDRLAREGVLFETMVADSSWTLPTHLTLLTGLSSWAHGVVTDDRRLPQGVPTLASILRDHGYETEGLASGPYLHPIFGFDEGFDRYELLVETPLDDEGMTAERLGSVPGVRAALEASERRARGGRTSEPLAQGVERAVARAAGRPFFVFVHMFDVHYDYDPPEPYWRRFDPDYDGDLSPHGFIENPRIHRRMPARDLEHVIARYDGEILYTDEHVGRMLDVLELYGVADRTIVAVVGDHGDEFFEHGEKGHRHTLYDEQLLVPFVLWGPGALPAARRVGMQVRMSDVAPTLLAVLGVPAPEPISGRSLLPWVTGGEEERDLPALSTLATPGLMLRTLREGDGKWQLTVPFSELANPGAGRLEYFDLRADPGEQRSRSEVDRAARGRAEIERLYAREQSLRPADAAAQTTGALPAPLRDALEALGYLETPDE